MTTQFPSNQTGMKFRAYVEGFVGHFATTADLTTWAKALIRQYPDLVGKTLQVHQADVVDGSCAQYSNKFRAIVIGA